MDIQSILLFYLFVTTFSSIFVGMVYLTDRGRRSMKMLLISNVAQLVAIVIIYVDGVAGSFDRVPYSDALAVIQVTFWILALSAILELPVGTRWLVGINVVAFVVGLSLQVAGGDVGTARGVTSLVMALICGGFAVAVAQRARRRRGAVLTISSLAPVASFFLLRGLYRFAVELEIEGLFTPDGSVFFFIAVSLTINVLMNLLIIYLHFSGIVARVQHLFDHDVLTGVLARHQFALLLEQKLKEVRRGGSPMALAMLDLDDFKRVNDTFGHVVGDEVLRDVADCLRSSLRESDIVGRYGGDEFVVLLEADLANATRVLEGVLSTMAERTFSSQDIASTFSAGVVALDPDRVWVVSQWFEAVDRSLYGAKQAGKNQIVAGIGESV